MSFKNDKEFRQNCKGLVNAKMPLHPYMDCENIKQDSIPVSACIVAAARGFKLCKTCENGGVK